MKSRVYTIIILASIVTGISFANNAFSSDSYVSNATIRVAESCSITSTLNVAHTASIPNGIYSATYSDGGHDYTNGIGQTTIKAFCNDSGGFSIYAVGYTNDEYGNTDLTGALENIATGTATSGETSNWSMKLGTVAGTYAPTLENGYGVYKEVPSTYTKVASFNSTTDLTIGSSITTTYAAYISLSQATGYYSGQVKYTLVHPDSDTPAQPEPASPGKIVYHLNSNKAIGTTADQSAGNSASVTLYPSNSSREGYGFAGWSTTFDYSDPDGFYGPNETIITPDDTSTNGLSLYAIWVKSTGSLQNWSGCNALAPGAVTALTDQRDNDTYAVAKLADGNCWMIENLRLDNTNLDNSTGTMAQGYGTSSTYGNFSGLAEPEESWGSDSTEANSLYSIDGSNDTINIGTRNASYRFPRYNNQNTATRDSSTTTSQNIYSYGNYYTWHAVIASTASYSSDSSATTSICPAGWHIPTGGKVTADYHSEYFTLVHDGLMENLEPVQAEGYDYVYYSRDITNSAGDTASDALRRYPNNFVYSDSVGGSHSNNGMYWTSTAASSQSAYDFRVYTRDNYPGTNAAYSHRGWTVRCMISANP